MKFRRIGQETEYAIRFTPLEDGGRPGNAAIYRALRDAVGEVVHTAPGSRAEPNQQFFTENGGAFYYEFLPHAYQGGLIEGATPECHGPGELLLYQRAQESLLIRAIPLAESSLADDGWPGSIGLIKNCRDAEGHTYGAQENYEAEVASGVGLFALRAVAALSLVLGAAVTLFSLVFAIVLFLPFFVLMGLVAGVVSEWDEASLARSSWRRRVRAGMKRWIDQDDPHALDEFFCLVDYRLIFPFMFVALIPYNLAFRVLAFPRQRRSMEGFLVSRVIVSGAGCLPEGGTFALSEKGVAVRSVSRWLPTPSSRSIFDNSNALKSLMTANLNLMLLRTEALRSVFSRRQRLQLGLSDSNRCQVAEFLKTGTALLVLEMAEAGKLDDAPRLLDPVKALRTLVSDPALKAGVEVKGGGRMSGLDLQRFYLERARRYLEESSSVVEEHREVVRIWSEVLEALERDPGELVGRVDWVSKRYLLETSGRGLSQDSLKKIDIAYHELGSGYFELLEREGIAPIMVGFEEIERAVSEPPSPGSARLRSQVIREVSFEGQRAKISWSSAEIGGFFRRRRISFDGE